MSSQPPLPPYVPPPQFRSFAGLEQKRALHGDVAMKVLIASAALSGIGFGLCSVAAYAAQGRSKVSIFIGVGASGFFLGLVGLLVSLAWLLVSVFVGRNQR